MDLYKESANFMVRCSVLLGIVLFGLINSAHGSNSFYLGNAYLNANFISLNSKPIRVKDQPSQVELSNLPENEKQKLLNNFKIAEDFLKTHGLELSASPQISIEPSLSHEGFYNFQTREIHLRPNQTNELQQSILIHELVHAIRDQHNIRESRWLNEGLALYFEYEFSKKWPIKLNNAFIFTPYFFLTEDPKFYGMNGPGYSSSFLFVAFLANHFGGSRLVSSMVQSQKSGWENILNALNAVDNFNNFLIEHCKTEIDDCKNRAKDILLYNFSIALWMKNKNVNSFFEVNKDYTPLLGRFGQIKELLSVFNTQQIKEFDSFIFFAKTCLDINSDKYITLLSSVPLNVKLYNNPADCAKTNSDKNPVYIFIK